MVTYYDIYLILSLLGSLKAMEGNCVTSTRNARQAAANHAWDRVLVAVILGADPQDAPRQPDAAISALHYAINAGRVDVAEALIRLGARPEHLFLGNSFHGDTPPSMWLPFEMTCKRLICSSECRNPG